MGNKANKMDCIVEYDYPAEQDDELTLKTGEIITNVVQNPGGWWEGILRGKTGKFPETFVKVICLQAESTNSSIQISTPSNPIRRFRVTCLYHTPHMGYLQPQLGDEIKLVAKENDIWWLGKLENTEGLFSSEFVEEIFDDIEASSAGATGTSSSESNPSFSSQNLSNHATQNEPHLNQSEDLMNTTALSSNTNQRRRFRVNCTYLRPQSHHGYLQLQAGDEIEFIAEEGDQWWRGKFRNSVGLFHSEFVDEIEEPHDPESTGLLEVVELQKNRIQHEDLQKTIITEYCLKFLDSRNSSAPDTTCSICWDEHISFVFQCGHTIGKTCYEEMKKRDIEKKKQETDFLCHQCRAIVTTVIKLYL